MGHERYESRMQICDHDEGLSYDKERWYEIARRSIPPLVRVRAGLQRQVVGDAGIRPGRAPLGAGVPEGHRSHGPFAGRAATLAQSLGSLARFARHLSAGNEV